MKPYTIYRTGDCAVTIDLGQEISEELNRKVLAMKGWLHTYQDYGIKDVITSYSALSISYDFMRIRKLSGGNNFEYISSLLQKAYDESQISDEEKIIIKIPVCYDPDYGPDQQEICSAKSISTEDLIRIHMSVDYRVYMVGFLP